MGKLSRSSVGNSTPDGPAEGRLMVRFKPLHASAPMLHNGPGWASGAVVPQRLDLPLFEDLPGYGVIAAANAENGAELARRIVQRHEPVLTAHLEGMDSEPSVGEARSGVPGCLECRFSGADSHGLLEMNGRSYLQSCSEASLPPSRLGVEQRRVCQLNA